jgi:formyltetrahydrofolate deformylase
MPHRILAVISVVGQDQKGVVARVSTYLAERGVNIEDIEQQVLQGLFAMNMMVDLSDLEGPLDTALSGLVELGRSIGMTIEVRLLGRHRSPRIAIMVTKERHCLTQIFAEQDEGLIDAEICGILSNRPDLQDMAVARGIPFHYFGQPDREDRDRAIMELLEQLDPRLIVLARYMQVLTPAFVERFRHRVINIHPSLLPYHPGASAYRQAYEAGRRVAGCTAHFVTEDLDEGPIILQDVFHIDVGQDTLDDVKTKGQRLEAQVLARSVRLFLNEELVVRDNKVVYKPGLDFYRKHLKVRMASPS